MTTQVVLQRQTRNRYIRVTADQLSIAKELSKGTRSGLEMEFESHLNLMIQMI